MHEGKKTCAFTTTLMQISSTSECAHTMQCLVHEKPIVRLDCRHGGSFPALRHFWHFRKAEPFHQQIQAADWGRSKSKHLHEMKNKQRIKSLIKEGVRCKWLFFSWKPTHFGNKRINLLQGLDVDENDRLNGSNLTQFRRTGLPWFLINLWFHLERCRNVLKVGYSSTCTFKTWRIGILLSSKYVG